ncbi:MAG TPA: Ig-like domain-containing protein [Gemmatimonadales bacterium]|nr:Ig-like domain-containing protein [Gemmatimonadales bacterium]
MNTKHLLCCLTALSLVACGDDDTVDPTAIPAAIFPFSGNGQQGAPGTQLGAPLTVEVTDAQGNLVPGATVSWSVVTGGGSITPTSSSTDAQGRASAQFTLGPNEGEQRAQAEATGLTGSPVVFTATAVVAPTPFGLRIVSGGNNVPDRYSSDLWVHGNYAYTGTWGFRNELGNALNVWSLDATGAPSLARTVLVGGIGTVSDVQVSEDGQLLVLSGEQGGEGGIYTYSLSDPANPTLLGSATVGDRGVHTVTLASIDGRNYAFAAMNPDPGAGPVEGMPALMIYDITNPAAPTLVRREPVEPHYGIHDTFVRDGIAFVFAWDEGVIIYDVGNGMRGGTPSAPVEISRLITAATSNSSPAVHNGWWFHNQVTGERRYLFVGQEGPGVVGALSSGDIHVVDVSDLANPVEVASFHLNGAGTHNFWVDETRQILYAAYYNAGVVALDVSGTLSGNLSGRILGRIQPGGSDNTYTWGVQLANGSLYAIDMESGLWQLRPE